LAFSLLVSSAFSFSLPPSAAFFCCFFPAPKSSFSAARGFSSASPSVCWLFGRYLRFGDALLAAATDREQLWPSKQQAEGAG